MRISTKHFKKRIVLFAMVAALLAAEFVNMQFLSPAASAYTNQPVSPIQADMTKAAPRSGAVDSGTPSNMIRHVIKKGGSSDAEEVQMAAYFSEAQVNNQHRIQIADMDTTQSDDNNNYQRCHAAPHGTTASNFILVTLSITTTIGTPGSTAREVIYRIPGNQVCNTNGNTQNNTIANRNNARFFGYYNLPTGFTGTNCSTGGPGAVCDANTGLYKVVINIKYGPGATQNDAGGNNGRNKQQVTFRVRLNPLQGTANCGVGITATSTCTRYISTMPIGGGERNYSTLGRFVEGRQYYTNQVFKFGLPCSIRDNQQRRTVTVHDIDNGSVWDSVEDRDITLQVWTSTNGTNWSPMNFRTSGNTNDPLHAVVVNGTVSGATIHPTGGSGANTRITFWMQPATNYQIRLYDVHSRNLIAVGLPEETIFGDISCAYDLQPLITGVPPTTVAGTPISTVRGTVRNSSAGPSYNDPQSGVVRFVVPAGNDGFVSPYSAPTPTTTTAGTTAAAAGCQVATGLVPALRNCTVLGPGARTYPRNVVTPVWSGTDTLTGVTLNSGDRVCYMTVVNRYNHPAQPNMWRYSTVQCTMVLTQPKVALWGNDLRVGSSFSAGNNLTSAVNAIVAQESASWVEYAIMAPASVSGMASQSGAVRGNPGLQDAWSKLTFANALPPGCPGGYGCFAGATALGKIPDVRTAVNTMSYNGSALNHSVPTSFRASDIGGIIGGADLANFTRSASITTMGTITIDQDIVYNSGTLAGDGSIPQLILIGNNITIDPNVRRIDAWLIATDTINTCSDAATQSVLRANMCSNQLRINGPIMANQLALNRTYADASNSGEVAETINLRGDAYVWASRVARQNGHWQTVYTTELPPRY